MSISGQPLSFGALAASWAFSGHLSTVSPGDSVSRSSTTVAGGAGRCSQGGNPQFERIRDGSLHVVLVGHAVRIKLRLNVRDLRTDAFENASIWKDWQRLQPEAGSSFYFKLPSDFAMSRDSLRNLGGADGIHSSSSGYSFW